MTKSFEELVKSVIRRDHPQYDIWKKYSFSSVERGIEIAEDLERIKKIEGKLILDIGCGNGGISIAFGKRGAKVFAIDYKPYPITIEMVKCLCLEYHVEIIYLFASGLCLPFKDSKIDIVICNDVIEHVSNLNKLAKEISRVLKDDGILYLTAPNKYSIINLLSDPHYGLPFLLILPRFLAEKYAIITNRCERYTVNNLQKYGDLCKKFSEVGIKLKRIDDRKRISNKLKDPNRLIMPGFFISLIKILNYLKITNMTLDIILSSNLLTPGWRFIGQKIGEKK